MRSMRAQLAWGAALLCLCLGPVLVVEWKRAGRRFGKRIRVAIVASATGRYVTEFKRGFVDSMRRHFCRGRDTEIEWRILLWTDEEGPPENEYRLVHLSAPHRVWPYSSLGRWETYLQQESLWSTFDYVWAVDIDVRLLDTVCVELLSERTAVLQPYVEGTDQSAWPLERRSQSVASILPGEKPAGYFTGASFVASAREFARLCRTCLEMSRRDERAGVMPTWHDESYLNRYMTDNPPHRILSGTYLYPQPPADLVILHFRPKLWLTADGTQRKPAKVWHMRKPRSDKALRAGGAEANVSPEDRVVDEVTVLVTTDSLDKTRSCLAMFLMTLYRRYPNVRTVLADSGEFDGPAVADNDLLRQVPRDSNWTRLMDAAAIDTPYVLVVPVDTVLPLAFLLENYVLALRERSPAIAVAPSTLVNNDELACFPANTVGRRYLMTTESRRLQDPAGKLYRCRHNSLEIQDNKRCTAGNA